MKGLCQICGIEKNIDKHHIDYDKEITLNLCRECHNQIHKLKKLIAKPLEKPTKITCYKCSHKWIYKGQNPFYVTCPNCYNKVKLDINERRCNVRYDKQE
jgi:DNA-directed RNA polymerase subunit RPC12/RpoP